MVWGRPRKAGVGDGQEELGQGENSKAAEARRDEVGATGATGAKQPRPSRSSLDPREAA